MMKIVTWNVNSLKVRLPQVIDWLQTHQPDVLALQETKLTDPAFPEQEIKDLGYHVIFSGQPTYNGVAILSKHPIDDVVKNLPGFLDEQKRLLAVTVAGVRIINVYVPNGASLDSEKYIYKLNWLTALRKFVEAQQQKYGHLIVLGDFNIAPADADVYDPVAWEGQVLVSPAEREQLQALFALGLCDAFRLFTQESALYSWWDYRMMAFRRNRGLRIDLILLSEMLAKNCLSCDIDRLPRRHEKPSDHAPVVVSLEKHVFY